VKKVVANEVSSIQLEHEGSCQIPSLGLATKAMACKGVGQEGSPEFTFHAPENAR